MRRIRRRRQCLCDRDPQSLKYLPPGPFIEKVTDSCPRGTPGGIPGWKGPESLNNLIGNVHHGNYKRVK